MYQAGIGVYAIGKQSGKIYEWDDEQGVLSDEFDKVFLAAITLPMRLI